MNSEYITALETRAEWLEIVVKQTKALLAAGLSPEQKAELDARQAFFDCLTDGDTYFMNEKFCGLVAHAQDTVPDTLAFELSWLHSKHGWLWLETPYDLTLPDDSNAAISAVGWVPVRDGETIPEHSYAGEAYDAVLLVCYAALPQGGFTTIATYSCRSSCTLADALPDMGRMAESVRWAYAAFHLMAQKLTHTSTVQTDRNTRRRGERTKRPVKPSIRVVSLRRQVQARAAAGAAGQARDWQWQWSVRGHWRNQYYATTKTYKQVFIEAFFKGPKDRPIKPPTHTLFVAGR